MPFHEGGGCKSLRVNGKSAITNLINLQLLHNMSHIFLMQDHFTERMQVLATRRTELDRQVNKNFQIEASDKASEKTKSPEKVS
jgi:hypothetical protein